MRLVALFACVLFFAACTRDTSEGPDIPVDLPVTDSAGNPVDESTLLFTRLQAGPDLDTVYKFQYDDQKRISLITDSGTIYGGTLTPAYNSAGNMTVLVQRWNQYPEDSTRYDLAYNTGNQLIQLDYFESFTPSRIVITYNNGVPSKRTLSYSLSGAAYKTAWTWNYTVKNGNITSIQQFNGDGDLYNETTYTFNGDANVLKPLTLFAHPEYGGLELAAAGNLDAYFNKNLIATSTSNGIVTDYTYTYNDKKQLTTVVIATPGGIEESVLTRTFSY